MIGIILCCDKGERVIPLTESKPKSLIEIQPEFNYTILSKQLMAMSNAGIENVYLLIDYKGNYIKQEFGNKWEGLKIKYIINDKKPYILSLLINTFNDAINSLKSYDNFLVMNGNIVTDTNLNTIIDDFESCEEALITIAIAKMKSTFGIINIDVDKITGINENQVLKDYYINAGIYCIDRDVLGMLSSFDSPNDTLENTVFPHMINKKAVNYSVISDSTLWRSIDNIKDVDNIKSLYVNRMDKPWGYEKIMMLADDYAIKKIFMVKGKSTSFHKHIKKDESIIILEGDGLLKIDNNVIKYKKNDVVRISPDSEHILTAKSDTVIIEVSNKYVNDRVRINDDNKIRVSNDK